jgi:hypothetical protein
MTDIMLTIKTGYCSSLSGRTTLTYHIGWLEEKIYFQLHENSSGGLFSKEWVSLDRLCIEEGKPVSSCALQALFSGKSSNTGGFLLAVLLKEGLIDSKGRHYQGCDPAAFKAAMQPLIDAALTIVPKKQKKEAA